jgi:hypothetical protein
MNFGFWIKDFGLRKTYGCMRGERTKKNENLLVH